MITKNIKLLCLNNGDSGVAVKFKSDETLYFMIKTHNGLNLDDGKTENRIFKLGEFLFYPINMIEYDCIVPAFAITVHKSQGSDYNNILVILPRTSGHPLLNRQILYTAVTRAKSNVYIVSNKDNLQEAVNNKTVRLTGIK